MPRKPNKPHAYICVACGDPFELLKAVKTSPRCPKCKHKDARTRARATKYHTRPEYRRKNKAWRLKKYYNMTPEQFEQKMAAQGGKCGICYRVLSEKEVLVVDHDHKTGAVRDLLCQNCNRGLGLFQDSIVNLVSAMSYLSRHDPELNWDKKYLRMALVVAGLSKDTSTKVGAIIVGPTNELISIGFNGFPRGVNDDVPERWERPMKYRLCEHSERNAVFNAARHGACTMASTLYLASFPSKMGPCDDCCRAIIQAGISRIVYEPASGEAFERWRESFKIGETMLQEAGVEIAHVVL